MKEQFKKYLNNRLRPNSVNSYISGMNHLSEHHGTNIFTISELLEAMKVREKYDLNGVYREIGDYGNGGARNAIVQYCNFLASAEIDNLGVESKDDIILETEDQISFTYERDLHKTLESQVSELYPDYQFIGSEYSIEGVRIDVLLEKGNNLLVVELKAEVADFQVFGQVSMYMGYLQERHPEKSISGQIIASEIHPRLLAASRTSSNIECKTYTMKLEINEA